ncbi:DUF6786 family protein [Lunatibacter salilacus]|uniref:DUF6786 family protein n=1 Tax=Lunatibacter salilacus TaxID=2483804 RepID=UPI00131E0B39|nr:DUF6786 family protein [Lunatibacter salilacus]
MYKYHLFLILFIGLFSCQSTHEEAQNGQEFKKGTFGFDLEFLDDYDSLVVLGSGDAMLIISPAFQGKVFTSTASRLEGQSFGWINYDAISSQKTAPHINAYGGEDRFWLGPEGGQYSIYFEPGSEMVFDNWQTPASIDIEPWTLVSSSEMSAQLSKSIQLKNYMGTTLQGEVDRVINLLTEADLQRLLDIQLGDGTKWVGFESNNTLTNTGPTSWAEESGTVCIWILGMFNPSDATTVVIPYLTGDEQELGPIATTDYFGEIPGDRIAMQDGILYFKGDGKHRGKLGISPERATSVAGSYDAENKVLTIVQYDKPEEKSLYMNQVWAIQDEPYKGDVINSYNDGPLENGDQMGPFYELETVSPAAFLDPEQSITHTHLTFHFEGEEGQLNEVAEKVFGISLEKIIGIFD